MTPTTAYGVLICVFRPRGLSNPKLASAGSQVSDTQHNVGWVQSGPGGNCAYKPSNITTLHRTDKLHGGTPGMQNMKQATSPMLSHYLSRNRGLVSQKTVALAVPQNVNVQAYVPSFDGSGYVPGNEKGQRVMEKDNTETHKNHISKLSPKNSHW
ncbi:hypothetical protein BDV29DRAFT_166701 [Aspergillus leporis]|uniref:Uncharacterized protein n=1 Tax=Aspergillus leporis TaxID=41062 RepID=A0A5N5XDS7_9EURO|nr:hypothetical protein BDV29DRAFT_166701 [Aspergillus leporis]